MPDQTNNNTNSGREGAADSGAQSTADYGAQSTADSGAQSTADFGAQSTADSSAQGTAFAIGTPAGDRPYTSMIAVNGNMGLTYTVETSNGPDGTSMHVNADADSQAGSEEEK